MLQTQIIAEIIYEAARLESIWSKRSIIPETWEERDAQFKIQFINTVLDYLDMDKLPTPEEAHNSWIESYKRAGWRYGEVRDPVKKTHPDMVEYDKLPKDEKDKDAIFLALIYVTKKILEAL